MVPKVGIINIGFDGTHGKISWNFVFGLMGLGKDPRILPATLEPGKAHVLAVVAL